MNKVILKRVVAISLLAGAMCCHAAGQYEDRWFYVSRNLTKQEHVREIANIVKTAKAADLNGMLFACGVERWNNWPADRRARLTEVKRICDAAAYYDADDLESSRAWLETCNRTPGCTGIMYTTWRDKYKLLAPFGELVRKESAPSVKVQ